MAWTKAARDAAALTRKAHSGIKDKAVARAKTTDSLNKAILVQRRSDLAGKIKALRKGGAAAKSVLKSGYTPNVYLMQARVSTIARNESRANPKKKR